MQNGAHCFVICTTLEATGVCLTGKVCSKKLLEIIDHYLVVRNN